jgi:hypothetical protein
VADFVPCALNPNHPHQPFKAEKLCLACGLSVYQTLDAIKKTRQRYKGLRDQSIARGIIGVADGLILETHGHSHVTWWTTIPDPHLKFPEVIADE